MLFFDLHNIKPDFNNINTETALMIAKKLNIPLKSMTLENYSYVIDMHIAKKYKHTLSKYKIGNMFYDGKRREFLIVNDVKYGIVHLRSVKGNNIYYLNILNLLDIKADSLDIYVVKLKNLTKITPKQYKFIIDKGLNNVLTSLKPHNIGKLILSRTFIFKNNNFYIECDGETYTLNDIHNGELYISVILPNQPVGNIGRTQDLSKVTNDEINTFQPFFSEYNDELHKYEYFNYDLKRKKLVRVDDAILDKYKLLFTNVKYDRIKLKSKYLELIPSNLNLILTDGSIKIGDKMYYRKIDNGYIGEEKLTEHLYKNLDIRNYVYYKHKKSIKELV